MASHLKGGTGWQIKSLRIFLDGNLRIHIAETEGEIEEK